MKSEDIAKQVVEQFNRGIFPEPHAFTDEQIQAIAGIAGVDGNGTFADGTVEQAIIHRYNLLTECGENTWPAFAEALKDEKKTHSAQFSSQLKSRSLDWLREIAADCLALGISRERIREEVDFA